MKRLIGILCLLCALLCLCGCQKDEDPGTEVPPSVSWQEQYQLGVRCQQEGDYPAAVQAFSAAIEGNPEQASAYAMRGDAYANMKNYGRAITDYTCALERDADNAVYYLHLATLHRLIGEPERELELLQQGINATGDSRLTQRLELAENTRAGAAYIPIYNPHFTHGGRFVTNDTDVFSLDADGIYRWVDGTKYRMAQGQFDPAQGFSTNGTMAYAVEGGMVSSVNLLNGAVTPMFALSDDFTLIGATKDRVYIGVPDMISESRQWGMEILAFDPEGTLLGSICRQAEGTVINDMLVAKGYVSDVSASFLRIWNAEGEQVLEEPNALSYGLNQGSLYYTTVDVSTYSDYDVWQLDGEQKLHRIEMESAGGVSFASNAALLAVSSMEYTQKQYCLVHSAEVLELPENLLPDAEGRLSYLYDTGTENLYLEETLFGAGDETITRIYRTDAGVQPQLIATLTSARVHQVLHGSFYYLDENGDTNCMVDPYRT